MTSEAAALNKSRNICLLHIKCTLYNLGNEYVCALYQAVLRFPMAHGAVLLIVLILIYFT